MEHYEPTLQPDEKRKMMATNSPKFDPDTYISIASDHLVVYSIYYLHNDGNDITFEDIISACFTLFPKKFSLKKYPQWPDSAMIRRRWNNCRNKGYIAAQTDTAGFKLTVKGSRLAEKVAKALGVATPVKVKSFLSKKARPALKENKVLPAPVIEMPKVKQEQKVEQEEKAVVTPAPVAKVKSHRPKIQTKPARQVLHTPAIKKSKVEQEAKVITPSPVAKVKSPRTKTQAKPVFPVPVIEAPKGKQEQKTEVEKKVVPPVPVRKVHSAKQKRIAPAKKMSSVPVIEAPKGKQEAKEKVVPPAPVKKARPEKQKRTAPVKRVLPAPVVETPKVKQDQKPKIEQKVVPPAPVKKARPEQQKRTAPVKKVVEAPKVKQESKAKAELKEKVAPPAPAAKVHPEKQKRIVPAKKVLPVVKETQPATRIAVSLEEKVRAGKFVRMIETSDAYRLYKRNGASSSINEFDFRSLLLCTMESSPERLARNVELFKGYAEIHNRHDLIAFLVFCKDKFSYLFMPRKKAIRKIR